MWHMNQYFKMRFSRDRRHCVGTTRQRKLAMISWTRTLSDDRHPAGRHTVIDGMMEVFGDWITKISQIG